VSISCLPLASEENIMNEKKKRGAPKGNQNARKHGFYSQVLSEKQKAQLEQARELEGLDEEIAILRLKLLSLITDYPDRVDLQMIAASTIARLLRTKHSISGGHHKSLKEAVTKVFTDIAVPLGVKAFIR
jgi:hypothetical protein